MPSVSLGHDPLLQPNERLNLATTVNRGEQGSSTPTQMNANGAKIARNAALEALDDAKAEDIITIDMTGKSALADTMIIASGRSNRHVASIADGIIQTMKDHHLGTPRVEGIGAADWVLIDQGDVIVHVFRPEVRSFYNLEKLWQLPEATEDKAAATDENDAVH